MLIRCCALVIVVLIRPHLPQKQDSQIKSIGCTEAVSRQSSHDYAVARYILLECFDAGCEGRILLPFFPLRLVRGLIRNYTPRLLISCVLVSRLLERSV